MNCYDKALSLLALREHSVEEMKQKLLSKGYNKNEIEEAVKRLIDENYLSDSRFCQIYIRSRLKKNPEGKSLLILRLKQKGISSDLARREVDSYFEDNSEEIEEIYSNYSKKIIEKKGEEKAKLKLYQKGIRH
ncbi:MAG: regulatory protein RecX [Spirochaetales bacterium]|nr:regulatory protein RecX [Spirochaetales bacterium]